MKILKFKNKQKFKYNKKIIIRDLILLISVGIHQFEKLKKQKVKFNIEITTDPNLKPDIKTIINYESVINDIKRLTKKTHFELLESLSESIFDEIFKNKKIKKIKLKIEKLDIIKETTSVGIEVVKTKI
ncbi:MAG: dihydroneopterin aldolase [Candidatus Pelagibacter sp. TMED253]|nr:MAG: dihydroneopterin aldolase [Candidatus Pelagibacter sp. TMED253]